MAVKCPRHDTVLEIEFTTLDIMQNRYPVVTGWCPICKTFFISREILTASGAIAINGQNYQYLPDLERAYPQSDKFLPQQYSVEDKGKKESNQKLQWRERVLAEQEQQRKIREKIELEKSIVDKKAEDLRKKQLDARENAILDIRQRILLDSNKAYHAKNICYLPTIPTNCPNDGEPLDYVKNILIETQRKVARFSSWCCLRCKTAYFLDSDSNRIIAKLKRAERVAVKKSKGEPITIFQNKGEDMPVNLAIQQNILYVCKGTISCKRNAHSVQSATGLLLGKNGTVIKINTNYCLQCRKYFIGYDEYSYYRNIYGVLLGNIKVTNGSFIHTNSELAEESILHICGYSVNQTINLSVKERHDILRYLIDSRVSSKPEIIDYLNFFIKRNGKRKSMEEAVHRWREDLKWVREYQINRQQHFEITDIKR